MHWSRRRSAPSWRFITTDHDAPYEQSRGADSHSERWVGVPEPGKKGYPLLNRDGAILQPTKGY